MDTLFKLADASAHGLLWFMAILSIISVSIIIERFLALRRISSSSVGVAQRLRTMIEAEDLEQIETLAKKNTSLEGRALGHGLGFVKKHGANGLDELFSSIKAIERPLLEKNLSLLGTIASNAPYVGLLGTVMGIMKAFNDLAVAPGQGNEVVMAGIGHALVSTAIGLAVAIPAVSAFNFFNRKVILILGSIDAVKDLCLAHAKSKRS
jgi:biopolymer transport protein TolQ